MAPSCICAELSAKYVVSRPTRGHFADCPADNVTTEQLAAAGIISADPSAKHKPAGSSPALRIPCIVCSSPAGAYCTKWVVTTPGGAAHKVQQTIAHKQRRVEEQRTRPVHVTPRSFFLPNDRALHPEDCGCSQCERP